MICVQFAGYWKKLRSRPRIDLIKRNEFRIFDDYFENIPTKRMARKLSKSPGNIRYILSNRFYVDPNANGKHEVFIIKERFERAQTKLKISRELSTKR